MIDNATACLVTRGNVSMEAILNTLPFEDIVIWDNSEREDLKTFGRYAAMKEAKHDIIYFQDDDVIFDQVDYLYELFTTSIGDIYANNAHGVNRAGYSMVLPGCGAFAYKSCVHHAIGRYLSNYPKNDDFLYYCDFAIMPLLGAKEVTLPYGRLYEDDDSRLCRQSWAEDVKATIYAQAQSLL